jgi:hypothetical protein
MNLAHMSERAVDTNRLSLLVPNLARLSARNPDPNSAPPTSKDTIDIRHTYVNKLGHYT